MHVREDRVVPGPYPKRAHDRGPRRARPPGRVDELRRGRARARVVGGRHERAATSRSASSRPQASISSQVSEDALGPEGVPGAVVVDPASGTGRARPVPPPIGPTRSPPRSARRRGRIPRRRSRTAGRASRGRRPPSTCPVLEYSRRPGLASRRDDPLGDLVGTGERRLRLAVRDELDADHEAEAADVADDPARPTARRRAPSAAARRGARSPRRGRRRGAAGARRARPPPRRRCATT